MCADMIMCFETRYLNRYFFDDGSTKLCLTSEECVLRKAFVMYSFDSTFHKCLTGTQCEEYYIQEDSSGKKYSVYNPYNTIGLCLRATPDSSVFKKESGYECETGYLYIGDSKSTCVSRDDCKKGGATVYEENMTCIKDYSCKSFGGYLYRGENGNECVSAEKCRSKEGWHPYSVLGECLKIEPAPDGGFIKRADGVCLCSHCSTKKRHFVFA